MKNTKLFLLLMMCAMIFSSCEKNEGTGGHSTIKGKVYKINVYPEIIKSSDGTYKFRQDTIPAADEDVYIIYGGDQEDFYGDDISTDKEGKYSFKYLVKGNYVVYAYSDYGSAGKKAITKSVYVGNKKTENVEDIYILDGKQVGLSAIVGNLQATGNYSGAAVNEKVYCRIVGSVTEAEKVETDYNGNYSFVKLVPGYTYEIWAVSLTKKNGVATPVKTTVSIPAEGAIIEAEQLTIGVY